LSVYLLIANDQASDRGPKTSSAFSTHWSQGYGLSSSDHPDGEGFSWNCRANFARNMLQKRASSARRQRSKAEHDRRTDLPADQPGKEDGFFHSGNDRKDLAKKLGTGACHGPHLCRGIAEMRTQADNLNDGLPRNQLES
jgi:hypothetical protein